MQFELYDYTRYDIVGQTAWYAKAYDDGEQALRTVLVTHPHEAHLQRNLLFYVERKKLNLKNESDK